MYQQQWLVKNNLGIQWLQAPSFLSSALVLQGFCSRIGGVSPASFSSLNVSYSTADHIDNITNNRRAMSEAMGFPIESWTGIHQVHGKRVIIVEKEHTGLQALDPMIKLEKADAQITNLPGVTLITQHADCVPLYFLDPVNKAIGLSHAGWRGTLLNIAGETIQAMVKAFGTKPENLLTAIGPSAGPCHYEVDNPIIEKVNERFGFDQDILNQLLKPSVKTGHALLDLWQANRQLMLSEGVLPKNIDISGVCTICCHDQFFSHRQGAGGRQAAVLRII